MNLYKPPPAKLCPLSHCRFSARPKTLAREYGKGRLSARKVAFCNGSNPQPVAPTANRFIKPRLSRLALSFSPRVWDTDEMTPREGFPPSFYTQPIYGVLGLQRVMTNAICLHFFCLTWRAIGDDSGVATRGRPRDPRAWGENLHPILIG